MAKRISLLILLALLGGCMQEPLTKPDKDLGSLRTEAATAYQNRDYRTALPLYQQLTEELSADPLMWFRLGNVHARLQQPEQAVKAYQQAVSLDPQLAKAWHNMGVVQIRQAANSFTQMVQVVRPQDPLYARGMQLSEGLLNLLESPDEAADGR